MAIVMFKKMLSSFKSILTSTFVGSMVLNMKWKSYDEALISTAKTFPLDEVDIPPRPLKGWESLNKNWADRLGVEKAREGKEVIFDFIVRSNGAISDLHTSECSNNQKLLKEFSDLNIKWVPGKKDQRFVNVHQTLHLPIL